MIKKIALISIWTALTACAAPPKKLTVQEIQDNTATAINSAAFSKTDKDRGLTVVIPKYFWIKTDRDGNSPGLENYQEVTDAAMRETTQDILLGYSIPLEYNLRSSCFIKAYIYNTSDRIYPSVTVKITGSYLSSSNAWAPFRAVDTVIGNVPSINSGIASTPSYLRFDSGSCPARIKDVEVHLTSCLDVAVGDRRCR